MLADPRVNAITAVPEYREYSNISGFGASHLAVDMNDIDVIEALLASKRIDPQQ